MLFGAVHKGYPIFLPFLDLPIHLYPNMEDLSKKGYPVCTNITPPPWHPRIMRQVQGHRRWAAKADECPPSNQVLKFPMYIPSKQHGFNKFLRTQCLFSALKMQNIGYQTLHKRCLSRYIEHENALNRTVMNKVLKIKHFI